ncbi:pyridoxal phosphate-dependent aminotransferase [Sciscionella sediminilitoris]|uniref:pyridoxal phosphate-dependent aminotransferase n=1 Tax=Sciscionella sediminilitoris TaxID=1445613 RepID=UPI0004DF4901|nr:pyridoxal phosphate-dependent aminotransferase [Sciscionella sp. SE31]
MVTSLSRPAARLEDIKPSPIRVIFDRAAELSAAGAKIHHLEIGRPDFDSPDVAKQATAEALRLGDVHYGPNAGTLELRTAIAEYLRERRGLRYQADGELLVTVGANEAVFLAIMAFCQPGDEVVVPVPAWAHYLSCIRLAGATPITVPLDADRGYRLDRDALAGAINERTRMVVLCTPNNPTGTVADRSDVDSVAGMLNGTNALLLSDEIYADLVYGTEHSSPAAHEELYPRTFSIGGFAKAFAMDGWRLGWLAGPRELIAPALRVRQYTTVCPNTFIQSGAVAALRCARAEAETMRRSFHARRDAALEVLRGTDRLRVAVPDGAFYLYLSYEPGSAEPAERFALRLLEEHHVAVVPGTAFDPQGGTHSLRVSYACSTEELTEGLRRIIAALETT